MARYHPRWDAEPVLAAAARWRDRCLLADGSLFTDDAVWTIAHAQALRVHFTEQPDEGEGKYLEKLRGQLAEVDTGALRLAAEMHWALLLFQSNVTPTKKREIVTQIWSWSGSALAGSDYLADDVLRGIGSTGQSFNSYRWKELALLIEATIAIKAMSAAERAKLVADPWQFGAWLDTVPHEGYRQLPNLLRYLLFPDAFERITVSDQKHQILTAMAPDLVAGLGTVASQQPDLALDRSLLELRRRLAEQRGTDAFDFYEPALEAEWRTSSAFLLTWNPANWPWTDFASNRDRAAGGVPVEMSWSCASKRPEVGNPVFLCRLGDAPRGIVARGRVVRETYEDSHYREDRAAEGKTTRFIDVAFDDIRDPERDPFVPIEGLVKDYPAQKWNPQNSGIEILPQALKRLEDHWARLPPLTRPQAMPRNETPAPIDPQQAADGLFLDPADFTRMLDIWRQKKNLILQGAPGTGKSFVARRLAYAHIGAKDDARIETVQFHQSYGYEDFVQGYRPTAEGGFELRDGAFFSFCRRAAADPGQDYVFLIDEINRGNLSKIFGELMLLIEHDKRSSDWAARLAYASDGQPQFHVPENVLILGMMNTADRSLSLVDYALRRRFAFATLRPEFASPRFAAALAANGATPQLAEHITARMGELNAAIAEDTLNLGPGFCIGHSFFVPGVTQRADADWLERVIATELRPLLEEYWFDAPARADEWCRRLAFA